MATARGKGESTGTTTVAPKKSARSPRRVLPSPATNGKTRKPDPANADGTSLHGDIDSRQRVIDAAIACILEQGLYRASSNAIAERAGLTWGVIQYYFGTRERLMFAVLEEGSKRLNSRLHNAEITGATIQERVEQYFDILAGYYGAPEYLVFTQVLINLSHDPRTSEHTREAMRETSAESSPELRRLLNQVFANTGLRNTSPLRPLLIHALRGFSMSQVMLGTVPEMPPPETHANVQFDVLRRLLSHALALLIEEERKK
jgi:AcrR family transcriptional regulator